ncbi:MAG: hypothetical protein IPK72_12495 [Candidatus Eisenbacteria bacterium]|nr:hypothetical protein [Candidatus Eisenbacteria bacterium]
MHLPPRPAGARQAIVPPTTPRRGGTYLACLLLLLFGSAAAWADGRVGSSIDDPGLPPVRRVQPPQPTSVELDARRARIDRLEAQLRRRPEEHALRIELAALYQEAGFSDYARREWKRLLAASLAPDLEATLRERLAAALLDDSRAQSSPARAEEAAALFYPLFAAAQPLSRDQLLLFAHATYLSSGRRGGDGWKKARIARSATRTILRADPTDLDALLADGLFAFTLGAADEAEISFHAAMATLRADPAAQIDLSVLAPSSRAEDPDPSTIENEAELERWCNLVRADLLYGRPDLNLRGWETEPGRLVALYGLPRSVWTETFSQLAPDALGSRRFTGERIDDGRFSLFAENLPRRSLLYRFGNKEVLFQLEDHSMRGDWRLSADTQQRRVTLGESLRVEPKLRPESREEPELFVRAIASRGESLLTRVDLEFARLARPGRSPGSARLEYEVIDDASETVVRGRQQLRSEDALTLPGERRGQIWGNAIALVPGRYLLSVRTQEDGDSRSLRPIPFVVRDLAPRQLSLSDLELAHADPTSPAYPFERRGVRYLADPVAHIHQGRAFDLLFEIYDLSTDAAGRARLATEYAVVPLAYARGVTTAWAEARTAAAELPDSLTHSGSLAGWRMGDLGRLPDGAPLVQGQNFYRVSLPPEERQIGSNPLLKVVRRFELPAELAPGPYALIVRVTDLGGAESDPDAARPRMVLGQTMIRLLE